MQNQQDQNYFYRIIQKYDSTKHGDKKKVVLSGFPYDQGTARNGGRIGGSVASKKFRQTLQKSQLITKKIGLIVDSQDINSQLILEQAHIQLEKKHTQILKSGKNTLLVSIGGSNDQSYPNVSSLLSISQRIAVINLDAHFDVRPLKQGKAHSGSPFRLMLEDQRFLKSNSKFVQFGSKGATCSDIHYKYLTGKGGEVLWMQKVIRRHKIIEESEYRTQGGQVFNLLIKRLQSEYDSIFVSFDVDVINSKWMPGASAPSVIGGLTSDQAIQIVKIAGKSQKVRLVDFSEFNPAVEWVISSNLLVELFYHLCESFAERKEK